MWRARGGGGRASWFTENFTPASVLPGPVFVRELLAGEEEEEETGKFGVTKLRILNPAPRQIRFPSAVSFPPVLNLPLLSAK